MKTRVFSAATILAAAMGSASAAGIPPAYPDADAADRALATACPLDTPAMNTLAQNETCVRETLGQAQTFANQFHTALFTRMGITPDINNEKGNLLGDYHNMRERWDNFFKDQRMRGAKDTEIDNAQIRFYATQCYDRIEEIKVDPAASLQFAYTTAYGGAFQCVRIAGELSQKWMIDIDRKEHDRLLRHFTTLATHYQENPSENLFKKTRFRDANTPNPDWGRVPGAIKWDIT